MCVACLLFWNVLEIFEVVWLWRPLMTTKTTLPTLFEWTGTCRNVNLPKSLRQFFSLSTWRSACCLVVSFWVCPREMCATCLLFWNVLEWFDREGRWWQQKQPYLLCSSGLALAGTWTYQNVWVKSFVLSYWRHACCLVVSFSVCLREMCVACLLFWNVLEWFDCEGRWWQQKQPYLLCSSGLALAGTWTYQKVWGKSFLGALEDVLVALLWVKVREKCLLPVCCFGMFWSGLIVRAVDDNKNNLTYFVRVDWHLPERELTKKSEGSLFFDDLWTCLLPCCEYK